MKELSIEQKAKRYDEALEKSKRLYEQGTITESLCYVFPELAESEDEKIMKALIKFHKSTIDIDGIKGNEILAWLEKQGKQNMIPLDKVIKFLDEQLVNDKDEVTGEPFINFQNYGAYKETFIAYFKRKMLEKQGVQKHTDKVEPKFKVGEIGYENVNIYPETKEQRDLLFSKMKEAGYEWDDEKKELKKIEQKPSWSEEDERMCQETIDWFEKKCFPYALESENPARESIKWLKSLKTRYTWKPSDEQLEALKEACDEHWEPDGLDPLYTLYQELKKLK